MNDKLSKKSKSLKQAIERYNLYEKFIQQYTKDRSLDDYVEHIRLTANTLSENMAEHYEQLIRSYQLGNCNPLLSNLYDRLLAADEYKNKVAEELATLLRES